MTGWSDGEARAWPGPGLSGQRGLEGAERALGAGQEATGSRTQGRLAQAGRDRGRTAVPAVDTPTRQAYVRPGLKDNGWGT